MVDVALGGRCSRRFGEDGAARQEVQERTIRAGTGVVRRRGLVGVVGAALLCALLLTGCPTSSKWIYATISGTPYRYKAVIDLPAKTLVVGTARIEASQWPGICPGVGGNAVIINTAGAVLASSGYRWPSSCVAWFEVTVAMTRQNRSYKARGTFIFSGVFGYYNTFNTPSVR